jgi:hypothetical protein
LALFGERRDLDKAFDELRPELGDDEDFRHLEAFVRGTRRGVLRGLESFEAVPEP